jgi:hypothetical protein
VNRRRQLRLLARPLLRSMRWQPVPAALLVSVLLVWWQDDAYPSRQVWLLRGVAVVLAAGLATALDDRTRATVAAVPLPLRLRTALPVALAAVPLTLTWAVLAVVVDARHSGTLPVLALSLEAAAVAALTVAVAAVVARRGVTDPGAVVGPVLLAVALGLPTLPRAIALAVDVGPGWTAAHLRWAAVLLVALGAGVLAVRDPAATGVRRQGANGRWARTRRPRSSSPSTSTSSVETRPPVSRMNVSSDIRNVTSTSSATSSEATGPSSPTRTVS